MPLGIDRRLLYNVDWVLLGSALVLSLLGVAMVYSATHSGDRPDQHLKQLAFVGAGLLGLVAAAATDYRRLADRSVLLYVLSAVALVYVLQFGPLIAGTRRWIVIGGFQLQPSSGQGRRWGCSRSSSPASPTWARRRASGRCCSRWPFWPVCGCGRSSVWWS
jgi:cell division protein FtsW (lipid II flippase)